MPTFALDWALQTQTGHPTSNLVLIKMGALSVNRYRNAIYCGHREDLAKSCELPVGQVDWAIWQLESAGYLAHLDMRADGESWVCFPRPDADLATLREWWRNPIKKAKPGVIGAELRFAVHQRDGFKCLECGWAPDVPEGYDGSNALFEGPGFRGRYLALDHKVPRCAGGKTVFANLQTLCSPCNSSKGALV